MRDYATVERNVIGCMLLGIPGLKALKQLGREDFRDPTMRSLFMAIKALNDKGKPVDIVTVDEITGGTLLPLLIDLTGDIVSAANVDAYADILLDRSERVRLREIGEKLKAAANDTFTETATAADIARNQLREIAKSRSVWEFMDDTLVREYGFLCDKSISRDTPPKTGFPRLDRMLGGLFRGEMTCIGARPAVGKSAFALNLGVNAARQGYNVCLVSLEMSESQIAHRVLAMHGADGYKLRTASLTTENDWIKTGDAMASAGGMPIQVNAKLRAIEDIYSETQIMVDAGKCDILIVDYLQKVKTRQRYESDRVRVSQISGEMKNMALDFNIPVIALAQVKRAETNKKIHIPTLEDLKDSGSIEQDADNVLFLHRIEDESDSMAHEYPNLSDIQRLGCEAIMICVAKQRQGVTGILPMVFKPNTMSFGEYGRE